MILSLLIGASRSCWRQLLFLVELFERFVVDVEIEDLYFVVVRGAGNAHLVKVNAVDALVVAVERLHGFFPTKTRRASNTSLSLEATLTLVSSTYSVILWHNSFLLVQGPVLDHAVLTRTNHAALQPVLVFHPKLNRFNSAT